MVNEKENPKFTFLEHLEELRWVLIRSLAVIVVTTLLCVGFAKRIFRLLLSPAQTLLAENPLRTLVPTEAFVEAMRIALVSGLIIASPIVLFLVWSFVAPGLTRKERSYLRWGFGFGFFLFLAGVFFSYCFVIGPAVKMFVWYNEWMGTEVAWKMSAFISFEMMLLLVFGMIFEIPVVLIILAKLGLVTPRQMAAKRRYVIVGIFILAAILTPPEPFTQVMAAIPMILLYEISILAARIIVRPKSRTAS